METEQKTNRKTDRKAGILMPVSSLPSDCGIGTLGAGAYAFVDWLERAGMRIWQVLPLLPTGYGDSPYQSSASDALNFYFIDLQLLTEKGLLQETDYAELEWSDDERRVDYGRLFEHKAAVLRKAFARMDRTDGEWQAFLSKGKYRDFAIFTALKNKFSHAPWTDWQAPYREYDEQVVEQFARENRDEIEFWQFTQFLFLQQWNALRAYANGKGIEIMGDMPIYLSEDSVETWKYRRELFMLDEQGNLALRAGVPPDAFSDDGQLWGNPVYDWEKMRLNGYDWWKARIEYAFSLFDIVRIDHFRAFDRFYAIPPTAETAATGEWMDGPKDELFKAMKSYPIVAEDLGIIDDGVRALLQNTGYPGMKIFEFAFDGDPENEYLPSRYTENCVAYTGTHDNEPLRAFIEAMDCAERKSFERALEEECLQLDTPYVTETIEDECRSVIELLFASAANRVIVPMHDVLCMGEEARLNAPSTVSSQNWTFRFTEGDFGRRKAAWLKNLTETYSR